MLFRLALILCAFAVAILASDPFTSAGFAKQSTDVRDLTRRAVDREMRWFVDRHTGRPQELKAPLLSLPLFTARASMRAERRCAIPLLELRVPHPERFDNMGRAIGSTKLDNMAKAPPIPVCKNWQ
jgi:hypothetical protein